MACSTCKTAGQKANRAKVDWVKPNWLKSNGTNAKLSSKTNRRKS